MPTELPDELDCRELTAAAARVAGTIARARLQRIVRPYRPVGSASVVLQCRRDESRGIAISGNISARLEAQCQRCLAWMPLPIAACVNVLAVVDIDEHPDDDDDCVAVVDGKLRLLELIEDELLLNCPMIPVHDSATCADGDADAAARAGQRHLPFAALADLIKQQS